MRLKHYIAESIDLKSLKIEKSRIYPEEKLVKVKVNKFDKEWSKERDFYISKGGGGNAIGNRYKMFKEILEKPEDERKKWLQESPNGNIIASSVEIDDTGRVHFSNGRHRYAVLRDLGMKQIPVAMTSNSIKNAKKFGYI